MSIIRARSGAFAENLHQGSFWRTLETYSDSGI